MVEAGTPSRLEARLLDLGADTVLRDPLRVEVLLAYVAKYERATPRCPTPGPRAAPGFVPFAGGQFHPTARIFRRGRNSVHLTRREAQLAELLGGAPGEVVTYESMYAEILHRLFEGDTSNMRVLLRKLDQSLVRAGVRLRDWVEVIPKSGYRYRAATPPPRR
jgi:DNA-binding response OmpR family regulator